MLSKLIGNFIGRRKQRYLESLKQKGLRIGNGVYLNDGYFLDPAHCFLITIEDDVVFGPGVRIFAHDASSKKVIGKTKIAPVTIEKNAFIGGFSVLLPGVRIGADSIVGANSTVTKSIPPGEVWGGSPARFIGLVSDLKTTLSNLDKRSFPYSQYAIQNLTESRKRELISYLEKEGLAFIE